MSRPIPITIIIPERVDTGPSILDREGATAAPAVRPVERKPSGLTRLLLWFSPSFPTGAFAYSHGLEAAIAQGWVAGAEDVRDWIAVLLEAGSGWNDLLLFAEGARAGAARDEPRLAAAAELALALAGSKERRDETLSLGAAFRLAAAPWAAPDKPAGPESMPYSVAAGALCGASGLDLADALAAFAQGFAVNLVSAATRLVPLGQSEAVMILCRLEDVVLAAARRAETATLDDLGSGAFLSEIAAMRHETLNVRLFRS